MKEYFCKKEYKYIYLSSLCYNFANALIETFGTVMLYKNGVSIWMILLIYGLRFGITAFTSPLFITILSRYGIAKCILISNIFSIISSYFMLNSNNLYRNIVIFIFAMGLMGISNPSSDALSSRYVNTNHRGKFNSLLNVTKVIGIALASSLVAWGVLSNTNLILFTIISIFFLLHYIFTKKIDYKYENKTKVFKESLRYIIKSKSKYKFIYALRANHIIERLLAPLYLYIILADFKTFSMIIICSLIIQIITIIIIGKYTDKNIYKTNNLVTLIKAAITSVYLFTKSKIAISINKTISDNFEKMYETSIQTSIQNIIKESLEDSNLLSTIGQVCLCIAEFVVFLILSLLSLIIKEKIFYVVFSLSIISTIVINISTKKQLKCNN
ncbi:MAG: MFS transporter [Clostridia bacterium]|nr:MFS transporter [Clostridia bacterium]